MLYNGVHVFDGCIVAHGFETITEHTEARAIKQEMKLKTWNIIYHQNIILYKDVRLYCAAIFLNYKIASCSERSRHFYVLQLQTSAQQATLRAPSWK